MPWDPCTAGYSKGDVYYQVQIGLDLPDYFPASALHRVDDDGTHWFLISAIRLIHVESDAVERFEYDPSEWS